MVDALYDTASLSAISQMGIGPGKGVFTTVKQANTRAFYGWMSVSENHKKSRVAASPYPAWS